MNFRPSRWLAFIRQFTNHSFRHGPLPPFVLGENRFKGRLDVHDFDAGTLEGLPIFSDQASGKSRRTLSGLRRRLRQLDQEHPDRNVFVENKNQTNFEKELASRAIDPKYSSIRSG